MPSAMDRVSDRPSGRTRFGLGLALVFSVGLVDLGCSQLNGRKSAHEPPMLGRVSDTTDIYAMHRRPEGPAAGMVAGAVPTASVVEAQTPREGEVGEVGMAVRPAEAGPSLTLGPVALQAPTPMDAKPASRIAAPSDGVPDASRVLASAERRPSAAAAAGPSPAELVAQARTALDAMTTYEVALHRQERVNGTLLPEEDVTVAIRRSPRAVRLTWPTGPNQGREVLYRADEPNAPMHVKMANPAMPRLSLPPESPMVMRNSRHPVTEAGLDSIVEGLENAVRGGDKGLTYAGQETPEGLDQPQDCLARTSPTGDRWRVYFDTKTHLPSLVLATSAAGELLERYHFREVRADLPELASNEAFDANARWGPARGLFGRLARGESDEAASTPR
jgi:hypothetical protein